MKYTKYFLISILFFLASCNSVFCDTGPIKQEPDIISKPTNTVVAKDTMAELPKGSWVKTDTEDKIQVTLEEDTLAFIKPETNSEDVQKPQEIILKKNTPIILPENTYLQTTDQTKVKIDASTEVVLPQGTEITITKINWYAILFYCLLIGGAAWYYLQNKSQDKNKDGFED